MKLKTNSLLVIVLYIILSIVFYIQGVNTIEENKSEVANMYKNNVTSKFLCYQNENNKTSKFIYDYITKHTNLTEKIYIALNDKEKQNDLRYEIYNNLKHYYNDLKELGVIQMHFHTRENKSFLRMEHPNKYGDDLSAIRDSISYVNKHREYSSGYEIGRFIQGYRYIYPLFYKNEHIGSVELVFNMDLSSVYQNQTNYQVIYKSKYLEKAKSKKEIEDNFSACKYLAGFYHLTSEDNNNAECQTMKKILISDFDGKITNEVIYTTHGGSSFVSVFLPIQGIITNDTVGYIWVYERSSTLTNIQNNIILDQMLTILFLIIIIVVNVRIILLSNKNRELLREYNEIDKLTGFLNRTTFEKTLKYMYVDGEFQGSGCLLSIDIRNIDSINALYGHTKGDAAIKHLASVLKDNLSDKTVICRWVGPEFMIMTEKNIISTNSIAEKIYESTKTSKEGIPEIEVEMGIVDLSMYDTATKAIISTNELLKKNLGKPIKF